MSRMFAKIILAVSVTQVCLRGESKAPLWHLDRDSVFVGGCLTIVVDCSAREASKVTLRIDEQPPIRFVDAAGPTIERTGRTIILLSHNHFYPEISQSADGTPIQVRIPPIFERLGVVRLELEDDGVSWGTKSVEVVAAPANAQKALDLLYPTIVRGDESSADFGRLMHLLMHGSFGEGAGVDERAELDKVREMLPDLAQHPDWGEVFEMLVGQLDVQHYRKSITTRDNDPPFRIRDDIRQLPALPETISRCLACKPKSPFTEAIQLKAQAFLVDVQRLDRIRKDSDDQ